MSHPVDPNAAYPQLTASISASLARLRADAPDTLRGFSALAQAATRPGALDKKTKELIAMALSVAARCDPCIGFHAETLVKLGTSRAELEDMLGMCVYMGGGPSLMYAAKALQAYEEFGGERERAATVST
jgi:AhpD family alkylhydroperoxidase